MTSGWSCPSCGRRFARAHQSHVCEEAMTLDEYFESALPHERPVFEAVAAHLSTLGTIHVEPVNVGIFIKKAGSFVELRPKLRWVAMSFPLARRAAHPRIIRRPVEYGFRYYHVANLRDPDDLDDALYELLAESYDLAD